MRLLVLIAMMLIGTASAQSIPTEGLASHNPFAVLPGEWGWQGTNDCAAYPKAISFSADRKLMYLSLAPTTANGERKPRRRATYSILRVLPIGLWVSLHGETRKNASGKLVTWYLVILDNAHFCWHRSDWSSGGCTNIIYHCKNPTTQSTGRSAAVQVRAGYLKLLAP